MSDDGSEIDSKMLQHTSKFCHHLIQILNLNDGLMFGLFFVLYFVKLPAGNRFQSECVIQDVLWIWPNDSFLLLFIFEFFVRVWDAYFIESICLKISTFTNKVQRYETVCKFKMVKLVMQNFLLIYPMMSLFFFLPGICKLFTWFKVLTWKNSHAWKNLHSKRKIREIKFAYKIKMFASSSQHVLSYNLTGL